MEGLDAASTSPLPAMADTGSSSSLDAIFCVKEDPDPASLEAAMQVPITVMLGPTGPLLRKLGSLAASDLPSVDEIRLLKVLCISLKDMSGDEGASFMTRWWMKIARELCYDTDDLLEEVIDCGRAHHDFSALLARAKYAYERRNCFQWSPPKTIKPADLGEAGVTSLRLPAPICGRSTVGVHVELPEQLVQLLALDDEEKTLKVIPIHGCAGVGKTTVARTLYHKHGGKFQCRAFITASTNPYMRWLLTSMLSQLKAPRPHGFADVPDLINAINKHLQGKRYFIVIDDLWTASVWNIVCRAFPRGDSCSRIVTTTQIDDVALECCGYYPVYMYRMKPLNNNDESRKLFFGTVFGSENACPTNIKEVSYEIIRKCGGLPLAIANIARLLASEPNIIKWKHIQDSLPSTFEGMEAVVNLMYNSLPHRLRTCLLYLSMYAQGYVIKKDELVKLWVAEDFISPVGGEDTQEIAEGYFDELVNRGVVQAVDTDNNGKVLSCTVHQIVLDFIRHKSREENLVITVDYNQSTLALPEKVRRLSIQFGGVKSAYMPESIVTSHVRSLIFWGFFKCLPSSFMDYGLLRILILHIWADEHNESLDLTGIGELFLLKYLDVECNITVKLPDTDEFRWLQRLETLKLHAKVVAFPSDFYFLERLLHLRLLSEYIKTSVVAHMTSLRTLGYFDISSHSGENVLHLGRLINLQDLQLTCSTVRPAENLERNVQHLGSILEKLTVLQSLTLVPAASGSTCVNIREDGFSMPPSPPTPDLPLQKIELSRRCCIFFSLPKWFGELRNLCILKIAIRRLSRNDINMLKGLPALTALTLHVQTAASIEKMDIDVGGFHVLTYFKFMCGKPCLSFEKGAMPKVEKLTLCFNANQRRSYTFGKVALSHLTALTEVLVKLGVGHADDINIKGVESALADTFKYHPNTVMLRVQCVDVIDYCEEDRSTTTQKVDKKITEIEEDKKEITESSEKHVSELTRYASLPDIVDSRYARTDLLSFREHRTASVSVDLMTGALLKLSHHLEKDLYVLPRKWIRFLRRELEVMQADLWEVAMLEPAELDYAIRMWANEVREFSYEAEDAMIELKKEKKGLLRKAASMLTLGWIARSDNAHAVDEIWKTAAMIRRTGEAVIDGIAAKRYASKSQWLHPRVQDPNVMVGVEVSRDKVIGMLKHGTSAEATKQPKIVSIFGIGGLGKTTLAEAVYDRIKEGYTYSAFVSVSRNPDMRKVFMEILLQIDKQKHSSLGGGATVDATQLVGVIRGLLANKRYFFVVDDIWHEESWEVIKNILIENEHDNVVVTTTRILDIAAKANEVYELTALSHSHSDELFNRRLFGGKGHILGGLPRESATLLRSCDGVPLTIITMAVLLAGKPIDSWSKVREDWFTMCKSTRFLDQRQGSDHTEANTRAILSLIYYELPDYLQTFLLHLSIFPDNYAIQKETLIWKWVAEGLVDEEPAGKGLFEKGEIIFDELIHSSLIMPIVDSRRQIITGCRLHGLVLDMIRTLSTDVNFVTVLDGNKQPNRINRRIAVQTRVTEKGDPLFYTAPQRLRSFNATGCHFVTELRLAKFGHVRVLALEECTLFKGRSYHLKNLGKLHMLRYLGLYNTAIDKLPEEVGELIYLQTLDLRGTTVKQLPREVAQLRKLKCLRTDEGTAVPYMYLPESLEELRLGDVHFSEDFVRSLRRLTELRELEIWIEKLNGYESRALVESISMLEKIQVLRLLGGSSSSSRGEPNWEHFNPPRQLRKVHLEMASSRLPAWINVSRLPILSHLYVNVKSVEKQDLENLGRLSELISLDLLLPSHMFPAIKSRSAFPKLRCLNTSTAFSFSESAMPRMEFLHFVIDVWALKEADISFDEFFVASTLKNLPSLKKVEVEIISSGDVEAIHEALKRAVDEHPNSPSLHVFKTDQVATAH